jgi:hypothetical protein
MSDKAQDLIVRPYMENGKQTWELEVKNSGKKGGPGHYPPVDLQANFGGNFTVTIEDGNGVTFSKDPIWIQAGSAKPTVPVIDTQITKIKGQDSTVLKFHDANSGNPMTLTYVLNFNSGAPQLDPIIQNGGGGPPPQSNFVLYGAGVILLAALAIFLLRRLLKNPGGPIESGNP